MSDYVLKHHGIKGQKWGVRRFQNPDGTLTDAGKKRKIEVQTSTKAGIESTKITSKGTDAGRKQTQQLIESDADDDYRFDKLQDMGYKAVKLYRDKGLDSAINYIEKNMGKYEFDMDLIKQSDQYTKGEEYTHFLTIKGTTLQYFYGADTDKYGDWTFSEGIEKR